MRRFVTSGKVFAAAIILPFSCFSAPAFASIPNATPPALAVYGELPAIEDMAVSPSGEKIAILARFDSERKIIVLDKDSKPIFAMTVGDLKVRSIELIDEKTLLVQRSSTEELGYGFTQDKFEFYQIISVDLQTNEGRVIFSDKPNLVRAVFGSYGVRMVNGRPTAFYGAIELKRDANNGPKYVFDHGRPALYAVDLIDHVSKRADEAPPANFDRDWLVDADGNVAARLDMSDYTGNWNIKAGGKTIASGRNPSGGVYFIALGQTGESVIYALRDAEDGATTWYEVPLDGGREPVPVYEDVEMDRIYVDRRSGRLIGYRLDNKLREPVFFDPKLTAQVKKIDAAFRGLHNSMIDWSPDFSHALVRTDGNGDSGSLFQVNIAQRKLALVGSERPMIPAQWVGPVSTFSYKAGDGLDLDGILTLPPQREAKGLPLVMLPHGGPHSQDDEGFDWWAQALASRGYAVFQPNFRGSTNRDEAFVQAGYGEWGGKMQTDVSDAITALAAKGVIDPSRACIVGASYGGYAALAGVTLQQGLYRCAVSVAGVSDVSMMSRIEYRESGDSKVYARSLERQLGPKDRYKQISPRNFAAQADAPILLIHGKDDTVVAFNQSVIMADALKDAGKPYELLELPGEDHWLSLSATRQAMLDATVKFVMKHNPPD